MHYQKKGGWLLTLWLLLTIVACSRGAAGQTPPTPTPVVVNFAHITQTEPLLLPVGAPFTLVGYPPDAVAISDLQVVQVITPTITPSAFSPPETTLMALMAGKTELTITQNLCQGVSTCNGPALFLRLHVEVE